MAHVPVLLNEVIALMQPKPGERWVDGTVGSGGHALAVASLLGRQGLLIGLDQDEDSLQKAQATLASAPCPVILKLGNFRHLRTILKSLKVGEVDGILLDLGVHSDQLGASGRGFSFLYDEPLQMTMKKEPAPGDTTAYDVVNTWRPENLLAILKGFGEERYAEKIVKAIMAARKKGKIKSTAELVAIIKGAVPVSYTKRRLHFATRTFQALRLAVNDELPALAEVLPQAWELLAPNGRLGVISFHSLESRVVKNYFRELKQAGFDLLTKHAVKPSRAEILRNPRSRSAELRVISKNKIFQ